MSDNQRILPIRKISDEELAEKILTDFNRLKGDKSEDIERNKRYRLMYKALDNPLDVIDEETGNAVVDDKSKYSDTYLAVGASLVDTACASLYNHFFSIPDYMEIDGDDFEDDLVSKKITQHQLKRHEEMRFKIKVYEALQQACCFDYAVTLCRWKIKPGYVNKRVNRVEEYSLGKMKFRENRVRMEQQWIPNAIDRSDFEVLDFFNCYHDQSSKNGFMDSTMFIDVYWIPIEDLIANKKDESTPFGKFKNVDKVVKKFLEDQGYSFNDGDDPVERGNKKFVNRIKIIRYWTHDQVAEYAEGYIIRRSNIDGMPLQLWRLYQLPAEFKGMGILQRIERNQYDINNIINIKRDFQNLSLTPSAIIDEDLLGLHAEGDVEIYSGKTFINRTGKEPDKLLKFLQPGMDISSGASEELSLQMSNVNNVAGFGPNQMGNFSQGRKTAREALTVQAGSESRAAVIASRLEYDCLIPAYMKLFVLEQMNLTKEDRFKYQGPEGIGWLVIRPEDYRWNSIPKFSAKGTSYMVNKDLQIQQFMLALDRTMQYFPDMANREMLLAKLWQSLDPKDHLKMIKDPRDKGHKVPANLENYMMSMGQMPEVSQQDNHEMHIATHEMLKNSKEYPLWTEAMKMNHQEHINTHKGMMAQSPANVMKIPQASAGFQDESDVLRGQRGGMMNGVG